MKNDFARRVRRDIKQEERRKTRWLRRTLLIFLALVIWSAALVVCIQRFAEAFSEEKVFVEQESAQTTPAFPHFPVIEEDIYQDKAWLDCNRQINFGTEYFYQSLEENTVASKGKYAQFFYDFFHCIINGNETEYPSFFADEFPKSALPASFTAQKLYEMYALECADEFVLDAHGNRLPAKVFRVEYKILDNNGTFRDDMRSSVARPEYYYLVENEGEVSIFSIIEIKDGQIANASGAEDGIHIQHAVVYGILIALLLSVPIIIVFVLVKRFKQKGKK